MKQHTNIYVQPASPGVLPTLIAGAHSNMHSFGASVTTGDQYRILNRDSIDKSGAALYGVNRYAWQPLQSSRHHVTGLA